MYDVEIYYSKVVVVYMLIDVFYSYKIKNIE